jgi:tetratricopeptide (TPR) repeat protein
MNQLGVRSVASALMASTALPALAYAQIRLPQSQPVVTPITPTGQALPVQGAEARTAAAGVTAAFVEQADTQRKLGHKDLAAQALQRALRNSPNDPLVLQRLAQYAVEDGEFASAENWTTRLRAATSAKDPRVAALERQIRAAETPIATAPPAPAPAPTPAITFASPPPSAPLTAPAPVRVAQNPAPSRGTPLATPAPAAPKPPADPGAEARTQGFLSLNGGDLGAAERLFNQALKLRPGDLDAAGGLGVIRLQQQRFGDARDLLARAIKGPSGSERWGQALQTAEFFYGLDKARTAYNAGRYNEAEEEARKLANGSGANRIEAQILLGQALARQGQAAGAEAAFRQAVATSPGRVDAAAGLAQALSDLGRYDEATRIIQSLPPAQVAQTRSNIERARADDLERRGDIFGAGAALSNAVATNPADPWTRFDYARLLLTQGQVVQSQNVAAPLYSSSDPESLQAAALYSAARGRSAEAAALLRRIPDSARNPQVRELASQFEGQQVIDQAKQLGQLGQKVQAVTLIRNYLNRGQPSFGLRSQLAQTLFDLGDVYQAGALSLDAARQPPATFGPGEAAGFLSVLAQVGQDQAAMNLLSAASRQGQSSAANQQAYRTLAANYSAARADRLRTAGDYADAFDTLSQAFTLAPRDPGLLGALARLYQSGNMPQQAQQAYDALLAINPSDIDAMKGAAQAAQASGDYNRAERMLHRAVSLRPNDPELFYQIGQMEQSRGHDRDALKAFQRADAILKSGRAQSLVSPGFARPGAGVLGPNPFARAPAAAPVGYAPAAAQTASPYGAAPSYQTAAPYGTGAASPLPTPGYGAVPQAYAAAPAPVYGGSPYASPAALPSPVYAAAAEGAPTYAMASSAPTDAYGYGAEAPAAQPYAAPAKASSSRRAVRKTPPAAAPAVPASAYGDDLAYAQPAPAAAPVYGAGFIPMAQADGPAVNSSYYRPASVGEMAIAQASDPYFTPQASQGYSPPIPANSAPYAGQTPPFATGANYGPDPYAQAQQPFTLPGAPLPANLGAGQPAYGAVQQPYGAPYPATTQAYPVAAPGADAATTFVAPAPAGSVAQEQPLGTRINSEIATLKDATSPQVSGQATLRTRSGEDGTSKLIEATVRAAASFSPFGVGQLGVAVTPVQLSAGTPPADAQAIIGQTPLAEARATAAKTVLNLGTPNAEQASGAALSVFYQSDPLQFDVGTTPAGFQEMEFSGGITGHIPLGEGAQLRGGVESRPVTDSVLSYAGIRDPITGIKEGNVIRDDASFGGSVNFGKGGAYADGTYKQLHGNNVEANTGYEVNAGIYYRPIDSDGNRLQVGVNVNLQSYEKNLRFFSFGQGGYFSPQQFVALAFPVTYSVDRQRWHWSAGLTLGMQSYSENASPIFPTLPYAQAAMVNYAAGFPTTVSAQYVGDDRTGVAVAAQAAGEYKITPSTVAGAQISLDTFGIYSEYKLAIYLRRILSGHD